MLGVDYTLLGLPKRRTSRPARVSLMSQFPLELTPFTARVSPPYSPLFAAIECHIVSTSASAATLLEAVSTQLSHHPCPRFASTAEPIITHRPRCGILHIPTRVRMIHGQDRGSLQPGPAVASSTRRDHALAASQLMSTHRGPNAYTRGNGWRSARRK